MSRYWTSFDLELGANYDELYKWLDDKNAKECGDSVATFVSDTSMEEIEADLAVLSQKLRGRARLYLIGRKGSGGYKGVFVVGGRKQAPWAGYGQGIAEVDEAS